MGWELLVGVHRADSAARRARREALVTQILEGLPVFAFDVQEGRIYGELWARLAAAGDMIGLHDLQIASTVLADDYVVVTLNLRDFERVPGLAVVEPR